MFIKISHWIISIILASILIESQTKAQYQYAVLEIPKIKLQETIYQKDSKYNDLKYGLYILQESNIEENLIIASHSGTAKTSYFKNLDQLKLEDEIRIIKDNNIYLFKIINIYEERKDGKINVQRYNSTTLTLITCKKNTNDLHLVISAICTGKLEKNEKNTSFIDKIRIFFKIKKEI